MQRARPGTPAVPNSIVPVVLAGRVMPLGTDGRCSGIAKTEVSGPWTITPVGIGGDEQADLTNHGGMEKAVHHYPLDHHAAWRDEIGAHPLLGNAGAFGENLSTSGWTEDSVHIGDMIRFGAVLLQVSQGRQPCWKLNVRFGRADMAWRVQSSGRTGWYYRVIEAGEVEAGAPLAIIDRPQPDWPLSRLSKLLYRDKHRFDELRAIADIPQLASGWRELARRRVQTRQVENWTARLEGEGARPRSGNEGEAGSRTTV